MSSGQGKVWKTSLFCPTFSLLFFNLFHKLLQSCYFTSQKSFKDFHDLPSPTLCKPVFQFFPSYAKMPTKSASPMSPIYSPCSHNSSPWFMPTDSSPHFFLLHIFQSDEQCPTPQPFFTPSQLGQNWLLSKYSRLLLPFFAIYSLHCVILTCIVI